MRMRKWPLALGAMITTATSAFAGDRVAELTDAYLKKKQIPGCAVMVRQKGKTVLCAGYGLANLEHNVPVRPDTVFQSGSLGKQFTATAVLLLARAGKLTLDNKIDKYLAAPPGWSAITVRHLLNHTSGLGDYPESLSLQRDYSEEELWQMITAQKLHFRPGEKQSYSNLGYVTLGILIHKVSGQSYAEFLRERLFQPLRMISSRVMSEEEIIPHRASGYRFKAGGLKNQEWVAPTLNTTADGSLYLTAADMVKWDEALENARVLDRAALAQMWEPTKLNDGTLAPYGFGWSVSKTKSGGRLLEHGGAWQGFAAYFGRYLDEGLSVAVFCNRAGAPARYLAQRIAGIYLQQLAPRTPSRVDVDLSILDRYAGDYRLDDRFTLTVIRAGDHLETKWLSEQITMIPESDSAFFEPDSDRTFRFETDEQGKVLGLIVSVPEELTLRRVTK